MPEKETKEKALLTSDEKQFEEKSSFPLANSGKKKTDTKFYDYLFAFFFGVFIGAALIYWTISSVMIPICNHGSK